MSLVNHMRPALALALAFAVPQVPYGSLAAAAAVDQPQDAVKCARDGHPCATFRLSSDVIPASGVKLANGYVAKAADWRAMAMANFIDGIDALGREAYLSCTAALVGARSLLTAAHCIDIGSNQVFRRAILHVDNQDIDLACEPDKRYLMSPPRGRSPRNSYDFALCEVQYKGSPPASLRNLLFETLDVATVLKRDDVVLLTGYGCTDLRVVNHHLEYTSSVGTLRINTDSISSLATGNGGDAAYVTTRAQSTGTEPALCPGDSGGPLLSGLSLKKPVARDEVAPLVADGDRRIRGVNSSIDLEDAPAPPYVYVSRIAALAGTGFVDFAKDWQARHKGSQICGVTKGAKQCTD